MIQQFLSRHHWAIRGFGAVSVAVSTGYPRLVTGYPALLPQMPLFLAASLFMLGIFCLGYDAWLTFAEKFGFNARWAWHRTKPWGVNWYFDDFIEVRGSKSGLQFVEFSASLRNASQSSLKALDGYVLEPRSGKKLPLFVMRGGYPIALEKIVELPSGAETKISAPFAGPYGNTYGTPMYQDVPADDLIEGWKKWPALIFVFEYNGKRYHRCFSNRQIKKVIFRQIERCVHASRAQDEASRRMQGDDIPIKEAST